MMKEGLGQIPVLPASQLSALTSNTQQAYFHPWVEVVIISAWLCKGCTPLTPQGQEPHESIPTVYSVHPRVTKYGHVFNTWTPIPMTPPTWPYQSCPPSHYALWTGHSAAKVLWPQSLALRCNVLSREDNAPRQPPWWFLPSLPSQSQPLTAPFRPSPSSSLKPLHQTPPPSPPPGWSSLLHGPRPHLSEEMAAFGPSVKSCSSSWEVITNDFASPLLSQLSGVLYPPLALRSLGVL